MSAPTFVAVDIGASGGRVMAGTVGPGRVELAPVHRFANGAAERDGHLRWDLTALHHEVLAGVRLVPDAVSIGIDTWGVDYGLLDARGALIEEPIAYRDDRTAKAVDEVHAVVGAAELFATSGLQFLPFTTVYQLAAEQQGPRWADAAHAVLLPDLLAYWLTGSLRTEVTNASTTGLLDVHTRRWAGDLFARLELPTDLFPPLEAPGEVRGRTADGTRVTTVASHDTASAVVAVPAETEHVAYVASGTWSLVGLELAAPVLSDAARAANFTNEAGVDGRTRFLRNVGGLWLLQECLREWGSHHLPSLLAAAAALPAGGPVVDVDLPVFLPPGRMPERIATAAGHGEMDPAQTTRCIVDSLAAAYAATVDQAAALAGTRVDVIHVVGGGSQNELLCRLTANAAGRPVIAGPVEATALGNVLVQARACGAAPAALDDLRALVAASIPLRRYEPA